ncbi:MAG: hypothetical protein K6B41_15790 [Butyrivibrio sp.]|nr:hypothetical protein [Butyrivibrio sp.]
MTKEYANSIMQANEIYEAYENYLEYDEKVEICTDAAAERKEAKDIYRHDSNEQIIANYYAKCARDSSNEDMPQNQVGFYKMAIDYYFDSYAVSCKYGTDKNKALSYAATCYYNIGMCAAVDETVRKEVFLYSIALYELYLEDEVDDELVTKSNIARAYMNLCKLEDKENGDNASLKMYYAESAYNEYANILKSPLCITKLRPVIYEELTYLTQYMLDNIDKSSYTEPFTKENLREAHDKYNNQEDYYIR